MPTESEPYTIEWKNWTFRLRPPITGQSKGTKALLLIHGWTGDEYSMWIFAQQFPHDLFLIAPRAPFVTPSGGYGWTEQHQEGFTTAQDFSRVAALLLKVVEDLLADNKQPDALLHLIGFSQGAALAYYLAATYPQRIGKVACLAGFIPAGIEPLINKGVFTGKEFFIAHGSNDDTVPVQYARQAAQKLQDGNARVIYCEDATGHKLGASCFRGLKAFIKTISEQV